VPGKALLFSSLVIIWAAMPAVVPDRSRTPRGWNADRAKAGEAAKSGSFQKIKFYSIKYK
jgi:hypothetical protein